MLQICTEYANTYDVIFSATDVYVNSHGNKASMYNTPTDVYVNSHGDKASVYNTPTYVYVTMVMKPVYIIHQHMSMLPW